jgi:cell division protein FtsI (penicillin-binding protein 3)
MAWGILLLGAGLLILNLFRLQVRQGSELQQRANDQQMVYLRPFVPRRQIVDRMGNVLALDLPVFTLFAHPENFKQPSAVVAEKIAPLIGRPASAVLIRLNQGKTGVRVRDSLTEDEADRITALRIDGLELVQQKERLYPQKTLTADVVGYVDFDQKGQAGVELSQQRLLERSVKAIKMRRMGDGSLMADQVPGGFLNLDDLQLHLTIDTRLQRVALAALQQQVEKFNAKRGTVIAMDAQDGSILCLVSEPSYDPNKYSESPVERFKNWALTDLYEPGSTFKPINVAIALEAGAIKPTSRFVDEGQIIIGGWPIQNFDFSFAGGRGEIDVTEIIKYSSNVGMVHIIQEMKPDVYYTWLKRLGMGGKVGIDLPSEQPGQFKDRKVFVESRIEPATTSFGQGFSMTPIQLVQLHAALANGGKLVTPHVVQGLFNSKGQSYWEPNFSVPSQVFSKKTTQAVLEMMEQVVDGGTGKAARIEGYRIAGKTGTAQKAGSGGYYENTKITSFVGTFPVNDPRYVVVAVVDEPQGGDAFGSTVAAPIVKTVIEALITLDRIPPAPAIAPKKPAETE